ncbi:dienelactone hydrolase family protein [Methylocystis heyeri]|uniref:Dienelactone hydrolase family protein n=1 Tax=Methylocystis heyeri TaxID=391905 RepID=A0A6B8KK64_9HYPH|nr:dienelactone hydrolase family protein [Methylocystis heyeri]QGM47491.1 dienelactone hydrolase family protein [Methylocystis heyeri]
MTERSTSDYARAAGAISSQRIATPEKGLEVKEVRIPTGRGDMPAYFAKPATGTGFPVILIAQEIFGLHEHIRDIARRFAALGYLAVAPDYFFRVGDPSAAPDIAAIRRIILAAPDSGVMTDFDSALDFAAASAGDVSRSAITGFCWGGRMAWLYARHNPRLRAAIPWYGRLGGDKTANQPLWPLDIAQEIEIPVLGLYGGADPSIPLDQIDEMRAKLGEAAVPAEIVVYADAPHAFFADYRESYRPEAAQDAWRRTLEFLRERVLQE